jgi:ferritin
MYIAGVLQNKGLDNLAQHFIDQIDEENDHAKLIYDFLVDMNAIISIKPIDEVQLNINSINDIATNYLQREQATTKDLEDIKQLAIQESNGVAEEFLRQMIDRQRNELKEASTFVDNAELCVDWRDTKKWNDSIDIEEEDD